MWAAPVTVTPPTAEPVELAEAKEFCRVDGTDFDSEIEACIAEARDDAERITGTRLLTQTVTVTASCFAMLSALPIGPVQSIQEIVYLDPAGAEQPLTADNYQLIGAGLSRGIRPASGACWPATLSVPDAVRVTVAVGYGDAGSELPAGVRVALLRAIRARFDDRPFDLATLLLQHRIWL